MNTAADRRLVHQRRKYSLRQFQPPIRFFYGLLHEKTARAEDTVTSFIDQLHLEKRDFDNRAFDTALLNVDDFDRVTGPER